MIDSIATQAAPVVRQVGAKAAELAAVAADRAGPLAHRAADATADASVKIAERSRTWAADLRNRAADITGDNGDDADSQSRASVAVEGADDPIERAAEDNPAEGPSAVTAGNASGRDLRSGDQPRRYTLGRHECPTNRSAW